MLWCFNTTWLRAPSAQLIHIDEDIAMATTYLQKLRLFSRNARLILIVYAVPGFTYFGIISVLLNLYLLRLGYGPEFIGLFNGISWLIFTVSCLPAGAIGMRLGSRRTMIIGMSLEIVGFGLLTLVEFMPTTLWTGWLLVTNSLSYLGGGLWSVNATPFLVGSTTSEERDHAFSVRMAMMPLSGFAGSLVGGVLPGLLAANLGFSLDSPAPYRYPLWIAVAVYCIALPALFATREVSAAQGRESVAQTGKAPYGLIAIIGLSMLLRMSGEWALRVFFNVYLDADLHTPTSLIGTLSGAGQLMAVPAALAVPFLMRSLGKGRTIVWASWGVVLSLLPLAFMPRWEIAGLSLAGVTAMGAVAGVASTIFSQEVVSPGWRALMSGASMTAMGLSSSYVSLGGGYVIASLGYRVFYLIGAGLTAGGALLFWAYFRAPRGELTRGPVLEPAE